MEHIVFICTGNVFRSFCAERALRKILPQHVIYSRGLAPAIRPHDSVLTAMQQHGLTVDSHEPTAFAKQESGAFYIAMNRQHQMLLKENFGVEAVLYQQLAIGKDFSILDINEALPDYKGRREEAQQLVQAVIGYIVSSMPSVNAAITKRFNNA